MITKITKIYDKNITFLSNYLSDILLLVIRIWIGLIFLKSGLVKIDDFETTIILFEYEYAIPILSPTLAASLTTFFELVCGISLILGFLTRLSAIPFIIMTIIIQILVIKHNDHYYWLLLLFTILIYSAGRISIDYQLVKLFKNDKK